MSPTLVRWGWVVALSLANGTPALAQQGGMGPGQGEAQQEPVKPTGPAAKKADDVIRSYTARIEHEIAQGRKEVDRLRAELHELIDVRYEMSAAIAELRGDLAAQGAYTGELVSVAQAMPTPAPAPSAPGRPVTEVRRDLFYGLGSALPKDPTAEQRDQIRKLAPRVDLRRMADRLRDEVDQTRDEVDQLAYKLLLLRSGVTSSPQLLFGGMGGGIGGGGMTFGPWFGSMGTPTSRGGFR